MNERIKELAQQADQYERKLGKGIGMTRDEKFAELIVEDVLDEVLQAMDDGMDVYDTVASKFRVE